MALKMFLIFVTVLACVDFLGASPTRRQYIAITEATASDSPVTNDGAVWDDNDEFDLDGDGWFSRSAVSSSPVPEKARDVNDYAAEDYSRGNAMVDFGEDDEDVEEEEDDNEQDHHVQDAEEDEEEEEEEVADGGRNDSEFLFSSPKDTRLVLEDDDDDQSGPIKVRHTGRNSYPRASEGSDNSIESSEDENEDEAEHPDDFAIDEDDKEEDEDDEAHDEENSVEVLPRREPLEDDEDEEEFVSEGEDSDDMFDNPEEEAAQVIYGDHVFLY